MTLLRRQSLSPPKLFPVLISAAARPLLPFPAAPVERSCDTERELCAGIIGDRVCVATPRKCCSGSHQPHRRRNRAARTSVGYGLHLHTGAPCQSLILPFQPSLLPCLLNFNRSAEYREGACNPCSSSVLVAWSTFRELPRDVCLCSVLAPLQRTRYRYRERQSPNGGFVAAVFCPAWF